MSRFTRTAHEPGIQHKARSMLGDISEPGVIRPHSDILVGTLREELCNHTGRVVRNNKILLHTAYLSYY